MATASASDPAIGLVLGAAVWPDGRPSPTLLRRARHGAKLWHQGRVTALIGCGGLGRHGPTEAEVIARLLLDNGVPASAIHQEAASTSTLENLRFALPILRALGAHSVVIVTDGYHAPRACLLARRLGLPQVTSNSPPRDGVPVKPALREGLALAKLALWPPRWG